MSLKKFLPASWSRKIAESKRMRMESALKRCAARGVPVQGVIDVGASDGAGPKRRWRISRTRTTCSWRPMPHMLRG